MWGRDDGRDHKLLLLGKDRIIKTIVYGPYHLQTGEHRKRTFNFPKLIFS